MSSLRIINDEELQNIIKQDDALLLDFYADWCEPCQWLNPILDELSVHFGDRLCILKIDVENESELRAFYNVSSVPTLIFLSRSEVLWKMAGFQPTAEMIRLLEPLVEDHHRNTV